MAYTYGSVTNCKVRNGQIRDEYECRLGWDYAVNSSQSESQDITKNQTKVKLRLEGRSIDADYQTKGSSGLTSVIDGTTVKSNASVDMSSTNTWQNFGERTITITHNADGTYSASKSGSFTCTAGSSNYSLSSGSASVTVKPATIPRASAPTVSASSVAMGSSVTINTNRVSSSFTHTITYKFGSASGTIASNVGASTTWTPPLSLASQIPNATSGTCTITCQTYNGSTLIGTKTVTLTLTVPSSVVPSISSITLSAGNTTVPSGWGVYVQGKSTLKVVTTASGSYGSSITAYKITGIDNNTYYSANFTSSTLQIAGTRTITVTVTDSRGRTATKTTTYTCVAYSNPSISTATVTRCNADGTDNEEGEYVKYTFKASVASVSSKNTYSYRLGYKNSTSSLYTYITISNSAYTLDKSNVVISGVTFSVDNSYDFQFLVNDYFTSTSVERNIGTGFTLMDFNASGKGMAIGKVSEKDALEIDLPTEINEATHLNLKADGTNIAYEQGNVPILRYNGTDATILSSSGNTNSMIYFRPNGTTNFNGQVTINSSGLISGTAAKANTIAHGSRNTTDTWVPVFNGNTLDYTLRRFYNSTAHTNYPNDQDHLVTMDFLSFWNGAYNSSGASNLSKCSGGTIMGIASSNLNSDNGYIRFTNGIQIAWKKASVIAGGTLWTDNLYYSDHSMGNWATAFSSLFAYHTGASASTFWTSCGGISETSAGTVRCFRPNSTTASIAVNVFAIGVWS